jgi:membrane-bound lytic murein transglycosylase MltF
MLLMLSPSLTNLRAFNNMDAIAELKAMSPEARSKLKWNDPMIEALTEKLEQAEGLPQHSLKALKFAENTGYKNGKLEFSNNDSTAVSPAGAKGMMQFMDKTQELQGGMFKHNHLDPVESLAAAAKYFKYTLTNQYKGNVAAAFADYNGGPNAAKQVLAGKKPSVPETANYLEKIKEFYKVNK